MKITFIEMEYYHFMAIQHIKNFIKMEWVKERIQQAGTAILKLMNLGQVKQRINQILRRQ